MAKKRKILKELAAQLDHDRDAVNDQIEKMGPEALKLNSALEDIQSIFDAIRNIPSEEKRQYEKTKKLRIGWKEKVDKIEKEYDFSQIKNAGAGAAGAGTGVAVAAFGPSMAMCYAMTFGVASTGTAISSLSGAAATNAALAYLGGGALAVGGKGMAGGALVLGAFNPIGIGIAALSLLTGGFFFIKGIKDQSRLRDIFIEITENSINQTNMAYVEIKEKRRKTKEDTKKLRDAIDRISTFGINYREMTKSQQKELHSYVNLMESSTQLLIKPIEALQPKYTPNMFGGYMRSKRRTAPDDVCENYKEVIISLVNFLGEVYLFDTDKKKLLKTFKKNKQMLESLGIVKNELNIHIMDAVFEARNYAGFNHL